MTDSGVGSGGNGTVDLVWPDHDTTEEWDDYETVCRWECWEIGRDTCALMCPPRCQSRVVDEDPLPRRLIKIVYENSFIDSVRQLTGDRRWPLKVVTTDPGRGQSDG